MKNPGPTHASPSIVLVCGDDEYTVKRRGRELFEQWRQGDTDTEQEVIDAQASNTADALRALAKLREALYTLPFFGAGKIIWFRDCSFLGDDRTGQSGDVVEALAELAAELKDFRWNGVRVLVTAGKTDRRKVFFKTVEKIGAVEAYAAPSLEDKDWVDRMEETALRVVREWNKRIDDEALGELAHAVGPNVPLMHNEVEKLCLYVGDRKDIEARDVRAIVSTCKQARAFALADAVGNRDLGVALQRLDEEFWTMQFDRKKSAVGLLAGLTSKLRTMLLLQELTREGLLKEGTGTYQAFKSQIDRIPQERLPEERPYNPRAIHPFVLFNSLPHARRYSTEELIRAMQAALEANRRLVSSGMEEKLVMQQLIIQIIGETKGVTVRAAGRETRVQATQH